MSEVSITIDPEFKSLIPPLSAEELAGLEQSIRDEGCRVPLDVWHGHNILLDGHNRHEICTRLGIAYRTAEIDLPDRDTAKVWIIRNQFNRRNLSAYTRAELAMTLEGIFAGQAKQRQVEAGKEYGRGSPKVPPNLVEPDAPPHHRETNRQTAKAAGIGHETYRKVKKIKEAGVDPETERKLRDNEVSVDRVYSEIKKRQRQSELQEQQTAIAEGRVVLPEGVFEVIAIDPPWPYGTPYDPNGQRASCPYPEMTLDEIGAIKLPAADDCVLWLWTTHKFMRHSFDLLDAWGFRDVAIVTWTKTKMGLGKWLRSQSEFCIMAVKGKPKVNLTNQTTVLHGPMREHSRKPDEFYAMVDSLCIGRKLDYFSREKRHGWEQIGNTTEKFSA